MLAWLVFWKYFTSIFFYSLSNKSTFFFIIYENYFLLFIGFIGFIGFKKVVFLESQTTHVDFCFPILFFNAAPSVFFIYFFSHFKQELIFFSRIWVLFHYFFYHSFYNLVAFVWQFIEWFDLTIEVLILYFVF